jgi:hypothetical protein
MRNSFRIALFILGMFPLMSTLAFSLPGLVNYKGLLTDPSGGPVAGPVDVTFTLWDAETGGSQLGAGFSDTDSVTPNADAIYDTLIGDDGGPLIPDTVFKNDSVWLNVNVGGEDLVPRTRLTPVGAALHAGSADTATTAGDADTLDGLDASAFIKGSASAYIVVETTNNAVTNGMNLIAAYATAKALTPHGQALGSDNRAVVLVPPGKYDLGTGQLEMDTEYVDVAGLSTLRENQHIYGTSNGYGTGVLRQTADDVKIENLFVELGLTAFVLNGDDQDPAAYFPDTALASTVVRNCLFRGDDTNGWSMRLAIEYAGHYEDCTGGIWSFGYQGNASGTFNNCTGGKQSFGFGGTASGTFNNCTGGNWSFSFGGAASGTFNNCTGGSYSFGTNGDASGTFTNCTGGIGSFGYGSDATGGKFYFCSGGANSFTANGSPTVVHCIRDGVPYP